MRAEVIRALNLCLSARACGLHNKRGASLRAGALDACCKTLLKAHARLSPRPSFAAAEQLTHAKVLSDAPSIAAAIAHTRTKKKNRHHERES